MADVQLPSVGGGDNGAAGFDPDSSNDLFSTLNKSLAAGVQNVKDKGQAMTQTLDTESQRVTAAADSRVQNLRQLADTHDAINRTIEADTNEALDQARPVFARQAAISARRQEVATMNPFKRAVLGLVNRNFNDQHLQNLENINNDDLRVVAQKVQTNNELHNVLYDIATKRAGDQDSVLDALQKLGETKITAATQVLQNARQQLGDTTNEIQGDVQLMQAQAAQKDRALSSLTTQTASRALAQASANGGFTTVGGAKLSIGEIKDRSSQLQQRDMALASQALALQNGRMELAEHAERQAYAHMTGSELEQANKTGMVNGHPVNQGLLQDALRAHYGLAQMGADASNGQAVANLFTSQVDSYVASNKGVLGRAGQLFGNSGSPELNKQAMKGAQEIQGMAAALKNTTDPTQRRMLMSQYAQRVAEMQQESENNLAKMITSTTRDPNAAKVKIAFLKGEYLDPQTASYGLVSMMQSGEMPAGIKPGTPQAQAWQAGAQAMARASVGQDGKPLRGKALLDAQAAAVSQAMGNQWAGSQSMSYVNAAIGLARHQGHPAGNISDQDFRGSQAAGDKNGQQRFMAQYGLNDSQYKALFSGQGDAAGAMQKVHSKNANANLGDLKSELFSYQQQAFLQALDASPSARPGFVPSHVFADFVKSGAWQSAAQAHVDQGMSSFGNYAADMVSGGRLRSNIANYGNGIALQADANHAAQLAEYSQNLQNYHNNPTTRAAAILAGTSLDQHQQQVLLTHIQDIAKNSPSGSNPVENIDAFIGGAGGKFQNPELEKARQTAAREWQAASQRADRHQAVIMGKGFTPRMRGDIF